VVPPLDVLEASDGEFTPLERVMIPGLKGYLGEINEELLNILPVKLIQ
jgi:hypothetical protein